MAAATQLPSYVKPAILEFKRRELEYLNSLSPDVKQELAGRKGDFGTEKNHMRHYGDFAFTVAGIKPCALFAHGIGPFFAKGLADACLVPVVREFNLEDNGFKVAEIKHQLLTSNPEHPGFTGGWVLVNTRHPGYALANKTFLDPSPGRVSELQIGSALGYPLPMADGTIRYHDATECKEANTPLVPVIEYFCPSGMGTIVPIMQHFDAYRAVWEQLGRTLTIDAGGHRSLNTMLSSAR